MRVTNLQYYMEDRLIAKLDLMIARCVNKSPKLDTLLLVEGGEGTGKTTMAVAVAYYVSFTTGRPFTNTNIFFKADKILEFAQNTENQIIIYDEPALDMLSAQWWKKEQQNLIQLLMTARKKRHFIIFNMTKFYKFPEYVVVDRAIGMIHTYSRNEMEPGRFVYLKKKSLEYLFNTYRSSKRRAYKKYAAFRGTFPDVMENYEIIDAVVYQKQKDDAIMSIGKGVAKPSRTEDAVKKNLINLAKYLKSKGLVADAADMLGMSKTTIHKWISESLESTTKELPV